MERLSTRLSVIVLLLLVAAIAGNGAMAQDGVALSVDRGPTPSELTLSWSGGQPTFEIFRSAAPDGLFDLANKIGDTAANSFVDTPPLGTVMFYLVTSPCVLNPPEVCDGIDNDCNGVVDDPGSESSCSLDNADPVCTVGVCAVDFCDPGFGDCDLDPASGCEVDLDIDVNHCGGCDNGCALANASPSCSFGQCEVLSCDTGFDDCDATAANGCEVTLDSDPANCGNCGNLCDLANASSACNASNCELASCDAGFDDCDATAANGCEIDINADANNCGACGNVCSLPNATSTCGGSSCVLAGCNQDFWDINGNPDDGCEYACVFQSMTDEPDDSLTDENCDGVDGDAAAAIFASPNGSDANPGSQALPMATLGAALAEAQLLGRTQLLIDVGTYAESITLVDGIGLFGGYDASSGWSRNGVDRSTLMGGSTAITASALVSTTVLEYLEIESANSSTGSSYGIFADASPGLFVRHSRVSAGSGRAGVAGQNGQPGEAGGPGGRGGSGCENSSGIGCTSCSRPGGGGGGTGFCGGNGGRGGAAGLGSNIGDPGLKGTSAGGSSPGSAGNGAPVGFGDWSPTITYRGGTGGSGQAGQDGPAGSASLTAAGYSFVNAFSGNNGQPGSGGGGGGGGGGGTASCNSYGGGGGGGGAGGCGGDTGLGGSSGGASIAIYLVDSDARLHATQLETVGGGVGGNGGASGSGGAGGAAGRCNSTNKGNCYGGSSEQDDGSNGGRGGPGGSGGAGGAGGGGAGGASIAVARVGTSSPTLSALEISVGDAGVGGTSAGNFGTDGIRTSVYPGYCGNNFVDPGEDCDDGGTDAGDGCSAICRVENGWSCDGTQSSCGQIGNVIFSHYGNTNPTTEGWTQQDNHPGVLQGTISADLGLDAWMLDDNSTASGSRRFYIDTPTPADISAANLDGWALRIRLRVVDIPDGADFSVYSEYSNGVNRWGFGFGTEDDGDVIVTMFGEATTVTLEALDDGYHLLELIFDPEAGHADLFVNGVETVSNNIGSPLALTRVTWGANQSGSTGQGNYNLVEWVVLECGNGILDGAEECDDGNVVSGDGCSRICVDE